MGRPELERMTPPDPQASRRRWVVAGVLLLATAINYMDRQTLASLAVRVADAFSLTQEQYGNLEFVFGWAFAAGSLLFGWLADRVSVRWLYPGVLLGWSAAGFATGLCSTYPELLACRVALGLFEAGHWPCALATTQRLLSRADRTLGNSVLQSGASVGAILTPPAVLAVLRWADPGEAARVAHLAAGGGLAVGATGVPPSVWQLPFLVLGAVGALWVVVWFAVVRPGDLERREGPAETAGGSLWAAVCDRRFLALAVVVTCLNGSWQLIRAWLTKVLIQGRGYSEAEALLFNSAYYIATDVGCLTAGAAALYLARRGVEVHRARLTVFGVCAALAALTVVAARLPAGWPLLGVLLVVGAGTLGLFPCYYSFVQELSATHVGKVSGVLAAFGWFVSSPFQKLFGRLVDQSGSFDLGLALAGLPPLVALGVLLLVWRK
ncbi:MAG: MFS transporter [Gemmataceae bacterium]